MRLLLFLAFLSLSAFAEPVIKKDYGTATWSVNIHNKLGNIVLSRFNTEVKSYKQDTKKLIHLNNVLKRLSRKANGDVISFTFAHTDERSQESVVKLIDTSMVSEMKVINFELKNTKIELQNLSCAEKGFLKKRLECSAIYVAEIEGDLALK